MTIADRLSELFQELFDDDDLVVSDDMTAEDVEGWDSLAHINLLFMAEQEFGVTFSGDEGQTLADVGELIALLRAKGVQD